MKVATTYCRIFLPVILLMISASVFATDERYAAQPLDGSKGQIKKDSTTTVQDTAYFNSPSTQTTLGIRNLISFSINEYSLKKLPDVFSVTVQVKIYATRIDGSGNQFMDSSLTTYLSVNYNKDDHYARRSAYYFSDAYRVKIKIIDVVSNTGTLSDYDSVLMLENEIMVNRAYAFTCTANAVQTISSDASDVAASGELKVSWPKQGAADEYDLEWTFIDSSANANYITGTSPDPKKIFSRNATRVSIAGENYTIPLLYDNT
ncbi:MAG TPA: hypothetical protein VLD19_10190, partial [Chitinophagaceae bacterium]|nr:hypothetical protein [Chitinophagaceae bacterium]